MDRAARAHAPRWSEATDALARHQATESSTHCDACSLRWPCATYTLAASHESLLAACELALHWETQCVQPISAHEYVRRLRAAVAQARGGN